ncbi:hypothetical protein ASC93_16470 [Massilia sp. Root335]|nr:hypothetical protein ASC93_16470 [Massilia sp. Root335]
MLKLISTRANIEITAAREIVLNAGGSYLRINAEGIEHGTCGTWIAHAGAHKLEGPKNLDTVNQAEFERVQPRKFSQQVFVDPALWDLPSGARTLKYTFLSRTGQVLGSGTLDGAGRSKPLFTDGSEPAHVAIDVNDGKWEQLVFDRPEGIHVPDDAPQVVFDYDHEPEDEDDTSIEESNDSTLS